MMTSNLPRLFFCTLESSGSVTTDRIMLRCSSSRRAGALFFFSGFSERGGEVAVVAGGLAAAAAFLLGRFRVAIVKLSRRFAVSGGLGSRSILELLPGALGLVAQQAGDARAVVDPAPVEPPHL